MFLKGNCQTFKAVRRSASLVSRGGQEDREVLVARDKIESIRKAFNRLQEDYNQISRIHLSQDGFSLEIEISDSSIGLEYDPLKKTLIYKSPISGEFSYL